MLTTSSTPMKNESRIDVPKAAILRLLDYARDFCDTAAKDGAITSGVYWDGYWDGYCRALEHVIEMENE